MKASPVLNPSPREGMLALLAALAFLLLPLTTTAESSRPGITPTELEALEGSIRDLTRRVLPATVSLIPSEPSRMAATGSGVVVSPDGLILTAAHVIVGMEEGVTVKFPDGSRAEAAVLGMDYTRDAGMVRIVDPEGPLPYVELGQSRPLQENAWCVALGHAGGFQHDRTPPVRLGRIIENVEDKFIRTDSALIAGDSGGPLFDAAGRLIGIHSNIGYSLSQNNHVPIHAFVENWSRLFAGERFGGDVEGALLANPDRPMIGAMLADSPDGRGVIVTEVQDDSPAERAGLRSGDRIVTFEGQPVASSRSVVLAIREGKPGQTVEAGIVSGRKKKTVSIRLASARKLGVDLLEPGPLRNSDPPRTPEDTARLQEEFDSKMRQSIETGRLQLSDRDYEKFRGAADFNRFLERFKEGLTSAERRRLLEVVDGPEPVRLSTHDPDEPAQVGELFIREVLDAFRPSVAAASEATHPVFLGEEWKIFCTVVHEDGYALAKASEIVGSGKDPLRVLLRRGKAVPARVLRVYENYDLALIKLKASGLTPVVWADESVEPALGTLISAAGSGPHPVAVGLVSVKTRTLSPARKGFLGIGTASAADGVRITLVLDDSSASRAGLREGDVITRISGTVCDTPEKLIREISGTPPGDSIEIQFRRGDRERTIEVELGSREDLDRSQADPAGRMNQMGTELSSRRTGFDRILQSDLPILPQHCGGPLVDLKGRVIGINVARAGRIKTYAVPAEEVQRLIRDDLPRT